MILSAQNGLKVDLGSVSLIHIFSFFFFFGGGGGGGGGFFFFFFFVWGGGGGEGRDSCSVCCL